MENTKFQLGAMPSPKDDRDYTISSLGAPMTFPDTFCLDYNGEIKNQGEVGSCVAHSLSYTREITEMIQTKENKKFSVGFIYANRGPLQWQGEGMIPREALSQLRDYGDVLHDDFPQNLIYPEASNLLNVNKDTLLTKAYPNRISAYYLISSTEEVKTALLTLGSVTAMLPIYSSFWNISKDHPIAPIPSTNSETLYGYHEITIIGWENNSTWITLNSWGPEWGINGRFYIPFNFPIREMWSISDQVIPQPQPIKKAWYRVQVGAFKARANAIAKVEQLRRDNFSGVVIFDGTYYRAQAGSFTNKEYANNLAIMLKKKGYSVYISFVPEGTTEASTKKA